MSKPDWCPQRVWDEAGLEAMKYVEWIDPPPVDGVASAEHVLAVSFSRLILAAEQREREACLAIAAPYKHRDTGHDIYEAIRNRGEHHD